MGMHKSYAHILVAVFSNTRSKNKGQGLDLPILGNEVIPFPFCEWGTEGRESLVAHFRKLINSMSYHLNRFLTPKPSVSTTPFSLQNWESEVRCGAQGSPRSAPWCENVGLRHQSAVVFCPSLIIRQRKPKEVPYLLPCWVPRAWSGSGKRWRQFFGEIFKWLTAFALQRTLRCLQFAFINLVAGYFEGKCIPSSFTLQVFGNY